MDDIRAIIQDELRQALTGLMSPPPAAAIPIAPIIPSAADAPPTATVPTAFAIPHAVFVLPTATLTNNSRGKPSNSIKVVSTMQMKKENVRKARKKSYQTGGTQQGTTSRAVEVHVEIYLVDLLGLKKKARTLRTYLKIPSPHHLRLEHII